MSNPSFEYEQRLAKRLERKEYYQWLDRWVGNTRLIVGLLFFATLWLALWMDLFSAWVAVAPVVGFVVLIGCHEHVYKMGRRAQRSVEFYQRNLDRINDCWVGAGNFDFSFGEEGHLYSSDLDIFGKGSLFELLCFARTRAGEETLARWLTQPASRDEIVKRQRAVEELRNNIDLREDLVVLGPELRSAVNPHLMMRWASAPAVLRPGFARFAAPFITVFTLTSLLAWGFFNASGWFVVTALLIHMMFGQYHRNRVRSVIAGVDEPARELAVLSVVLARLERERFGSAKLCELYAELQATGRPPSKQIARLKLLVELLHSRLNQIFTPVSYLLLWATQLTFAIEAWRQRCGPALGRWLNAVGELEALCAMAGYAHRNPEDPFPELVEVPGVLEGEELRHPLLSRSKCVPNNVYLGNGLQLLVVSGSNMSGKSTLLRTVGVNVVLALAGAPVRAKRLKVSLFAIGATLRVQDSLQGGTSRFYAEIRRLHGIMELTNVRPSVLFLLDEILHGTNSHDRAIGAEAVVRGLIDRGAVGLVTTHDLALAKVAEALDPRAINVHFQDHLENGQMMFDYVLHAGVVQKSNALELMRAVGLKV